MKKIIELFLRNSFICFIFARNIVMMVQAVGAKCMAA